MRNRYADRFRSEFRRTRFYLDKRNAKFMGVCAGIADYVGWDPLWVRICTLGFGLLTPLSGVIVPAYIILAVVGSPKPQPMYDMPEEDARFWQSARMAPGRTIRDTRGEFRDIDRRLADIESYVTSSSRNLSSEIDRLR